MQVTQRQYKQAPCDACVWLETGPKTATLNISYDVCNESIGPYLLPDAPTITANPLGAYRFNRLLQQRRVGSDGIGSPWPCSDVAARPVARS